MRTRWFVASSFVLALLVAVSLAGCAGPMSTVRLTLRPTEAGLSDNEFDRLRVIEDMRARSAGLSIERIERTSDGAVAVEIACPADYEPRRAAALLSATGKLEFVAWESVDASTVAAWDEYLDQDTRGADAQQPAALQPGTYEVFVASDRVTDAAVGSEDSQPVVNLSFDSAGTEQWAAVTQANVNKRVAIVLDGAVQSAPVILEPITNGKSQLSGRFTAEEANDLAAIMRSSALPQPMSAEGLEVQPAEPSSPVGPLGLVLVGCGLVLVIIGVVFAVRHRSRARRSAPPPPRSEVLAQWYPDPCGRHELRYWDGTRWTPSVSDNGVQSTEAP